jgi:hypothetical protein
MPDLPASAIRGPFDENDYQGEPLIPESVRRLVLEELGLVPKGIAPDMGPPQRMQPPATPAGPGN